MPEQAPPPPPPALVEDAWLPEKLARVGVFMEIEKDVYAGYRKLIDGWLDLVASAVLTGTGIDPLGIYAFATSWEEGLDAFVNGEILRALARAYEHVFGKSYEFSNRPFVQQYIRQSRNRLVRTPDEVYEKVKAAVHTGTAEGQSIPEIAKQIKTEILSSGAPYWKNRAVTVARTETIGAYNGGANDAFSAIVGLFPEEQFEKIWLATDDSRTRHTHNEADGQRVPYLAQFTVGGFPMAFPGDPTGPAEEVINCRCTMLLVEHGEQVDYSNKHFKGLTAGVGHYNPHEPRDSHGKWTDGLPDEPDHDPLGYSDYGDRLEISRGKSNHDWAKVPGGRDDVSRIPPERPFARKYQDPEGYAAYEAHNEAYRAVQDYTTEGYREINGSLRAGDRLEPRYRDTAAELRKHMAPTKSDMLVYRKTTPDAFGVGSWKELRGLQGGEVEDPGFTSTTFRHNLQLDHLDQEGDVVSLSIKVPSGTKALYLNGDSAFPKEDELLLDTGTRYRINRVYRDDDGYVQVEMTVVGQ